MPPRSISVPLAKLVRRPAPAAGPGMRAVAGTASADISTSFAERQNLTMRMRMRRFTRLTNAFIKKIENLEAATALHYMHYNFVRRLQKLRVSTAMAVGVDKHLWSIEEIVSLLD